MKLDNLTDEEFQQLPAVQRHFLRRPGLFALEFLIMMVGVGAVTFVCCKAFDVLAFITSKVF